MALTKVKAPSKLPIISLKAKGKDRNPHQRMVILRDLHRLHSSNNPVHLPHRTKGAKLALPSRRSRTRHPPPSQYQIWLNGCSRESRHRELPSLLAIGCPWDRHLNSGPIHDRSAANATEIGTGTRSVIETARRGEMTAEIFAIRAVSVNSGVGVMRREVGVILEETIDGSIIATIDDAVVTDALTTVPNGILNVLRRRRSSLRSSLGPSRALSYLKNSLNPILSISGSLEMSR